MSDKTPGRGRIYASITETIGDTPIVRLDRLAKDAGVEAEILAKLEFFNPISSVKDRIGVSMIEALEAEGKITIDHGPIAAVGWPAMTMAFSADEDSMDKVAVGDRVTFEFQTTEGGGGELTAIAKQ